MSKGNARCGVDGREKVHRFWVPWRGMSAGALVELLFFKWYSCLGSDGGTGYPIYSV